MHQRRQQGRHVRVCERALQLFGRHHGLGRYAIATPVADPELRMPFWRPEPSSAATEIWPPTTLKYTLFLGTSSEMPMGSTKPSTMVSLSVRFMAVWPAGMSRLAR